MNGTPPTKGIDYIRYNCQFSNGGKWKLFTCKVFFPEPLKRCHAGLIINYLKHYN